MLAREREEPIGFARWSRMQFQPSQLRWIVSGAPWSWARVPDDDSPASYLHRSFRQYDWRRHSRVRRALMGVVFVVAMPVVLAIVAVCTATHGPRVWRESRKGPLRQAREQVVLWLTKGVLPFSYYLFELHRDEARARALHYLYRHETKQGIYLILRHRLSSPQSAKALSDKALFARHCAEHGVPAVPALFVIDQSRITRFDAAEPGLPQRDLFLKPLTGAGGRGAEVWRYLGDGTYWSAAAGELREGQLIGHLAALSCRRPYVGRAHVTNHPVLAAVSSGALCSLRVMTCLDEANQPEVTHAVLRMARTPGIVVDNFHAGGIAARVDLGTGMVGRATDVGRSRHSRWWTTHPTTGAAILGRRVPMWDQVLAIALLAHAAFADQVVVGWDIAVLESGPLLIEGNKGPDLDIIQRTGREPIGNSRLGVLLAHRLRRALGEDAR